MQHVVRLTLRRARQERLPQIAGSLTFTTVLSVVPLMTVAFALLERFPVLHRLEQAIDEHLLRALLPAGLSRSVLANLHRYAGNASGLTLLGAVFTGVSAIAMLLTVEGALNQIWQVRRGRPLLRRIGLHAMVLSIGPPLVGASLWATSAAIGASIGAIGRLPDRAAFALALGPPAVGALGLAALFRFVPNAGVPASHALAGGVLGAAALELGKRGFAAWVLKIPTYQAVYGALAVLPVFLLWVYFSWLVTLAAALVTANLSRERGASPRRPPQRRTAAG